MKYFSMTVTRGRKSQIGSLLNTRSAARRTQANAKETTVISNKPAFAARYTVQDTRKLPGDYS